jgi:hypothetical protein
MKKKLFQVWLGFQAGYILQEGKMIKNISHKKLLIGIGQVCDDIFRSLSVIQIYKGHKERIVRWIVWATITGEYLLYMYILHLSFYISFIHVQIRTTVQCMSKWS